jgi:hypothetical protein
MCLRHNPDFCLRVGWLDSDLLDETLVRNRVILPVAGHPTPAILSPLHLHLLRP